MTGLSLQPCYQQLGFSEPPFSMTPDTEFFFPGKRHVDALQHLYFGIANGALTMLTGEVGVGKTLLCRYLLRHPPPHIRFAYILNPDQSYPDLLAAICEDLTGLAPTDRSVGQLHRHLNQVLLDAAAQGERVVVVIDEAHRLTPEVLEDLRLLSNLDTEKHKLLCLMFVGQPELEMTLARQELRPLQQRISVRYRLGALGWRDTMDYIHHRLQIAGRFHRLNFGLGVLMVAHFCSGGVPRRINQLCDRALLGAFTRRRLEVSPWMMWQATREIFGMGQ